MPKQIESDITYLKQTGSWSQTQCPTGEAYKQFCQLAATNEEIFSKFRQYGIYNRIVGCDLHGIDTMKMFINYIGQVYPNVYKHLSKFEYIDEISNPIRFQHGGVLLSPNTARYIKVLGDLARYFKDLNKLNICEIGPGYGGQSVVIRTAFNVDSYTYIDCVEALPLIKKYVSISSAANDSKTYFYTNDNIEIKEYDLIIADNSLSEMDADGFDFYVENVVSKSKTLYMSMNDVYINQNNQTSTFHRKDTTISKIKKYFSDVKVIPDRPAMKPNNPCYIIIANA